jgi:hypothetical protein
MEARMIAKFESRLARLERAVFGSGLQQTLSARADKSAAGPSGGVRVLISQSYFAKKRSVAEVKDALAKNDFHYRTSAIQTALNRLSSRTGPLTTAREGGTKVYVRRK